MIAPFAHEFFIGRKYGGWIKGRERFVSEQHAQDVADKHRAAMRRAELTPFACRVAVA